MTARWHSVSCVCDDCIDADNAITYYSFSLLQGDPAFNFESHKLLFDAGEPGTIIRDEKNANSR